MDRFVESLGCCRSWRWHAGRILLAHGMEGLRWLSPGYDRRRDHRIGLRTPAAATESALPGNRSGHRIAVATVSAVTIGEPYALLTGVVTGLLLLYSLALDSPSRLIYKDIVSVREILSVRLHHAAQVIQATVESLGPSRPARGRDPDACRAGRHMGATVTVHRLRAKARLVRCDVKKPHSPDGNHYRLNPIPHVFRIDRLATLVRERRQKYPRLMPSFTGR